MRVRSFIEIGILPNHLAASSTHVPNLALRFTEASHHDAVFMLWLRSLVSDKPTGPMTDTAAIAYDSSRPLQLIKVWAKAAHALLLIPS